MIADSVRTEAYRNFILQNAQLFKGKVVMDVGCGTGILSYFCSQAGAKKVFSIDNSDIIDIAKKIANENSMHNIQFIKKKVELIDTLGPDYSNVDIIISEWMGYCLLFECMLPSVLIARDRFCGNGGLVYPDVASMFVCGWYDEKYYNNKISFWSEVYGFKMNSMKDQIWIEPQTENIPSTAINTDTCMFKSFNINTVKIDELDFTSPFKITVKNCKVLHGFVVYFDIDFSINCTNPVSFSTGPQTKDTHWHQTIFILKTPEQVEDNDVVQGSITCRRKKHLRNLNITISFTIQGKSTSPTSYHYTL
uniref:type I protein arginine methyltransferase n=1 Tax=Arcella intermedia TaxID=1963864 RepID=A0A6B2L8Q8_9EUKA